MKTYKIGGVFFATIKLGKDNNWIADGKTEQEAINNLKIKIKNNEN